jgi:hypothetical protein
MSEDFRDQAKGDEVFGDLNRFNKSTENLDERGLILAIAAFAEDALGDLIKAFLVPGKATLQLLDGFNAPIGTFSARIKLAFSLGLITKRQYEDLERIRQIRNEFAHTWEPISFLDQKIAAHISAIHFSSLDDRFPSSPQEKVRMSLGALLMELRSTTHQISKHNRRAQLLGQHLIAGLVGELDDQISACRNRLNEIAEELKFASGDRRRFLLAVRDDWEGKLEIVRLNAPRERQEQIRRLQAEMKALNIPPNER